MLTPSYLLHAVEPAEDIAEQLHTDIIARIIERILIRFQRGDDYILTATDKWQIETLQQAGFLLEDIQKEIVAATGKMEAEIAQAMEDAGVRALEYDDAIYRAAGLDPVPLVQSPYMIQIMQRDYEATLGEWKNFTRISKQAAHRLYVNACDTAYHQATTGALSITQATMEAINVAAEAGVYVEYKDKNGNVIRRDTIETATTRAVRTGISQASGDIQTARMDEFGVDLVLVSSHMGARPEHAEWQGKIYSRSGTDAQYPDFVKSTRYGYVDGLCGANCRHNFGPWFEGMENPFEQYDSEENRKQYELEQKQRTMERRIRDTKRKAMNWKTAVDKEEDPIKKALFESEYQRKAALLEKQNKAYNDFCKDNDLKRRDDRISIAKWDRKQAAAARNAVKQYEKEQEKREKNLRFIENDATIKANSGLPKKLVNLPDEKLKQTVKVDIWPEKEGSFEFHAIAPKDADMKKVEVMAGYRTSTPIRDVKRLYETYDLDAEYWQKKSGTAYGKEYHYVIHWYENKGFVPKDEIKLKGMKKNK